MAVNYETGVATSPLDLLNRLRTFLGASSWSDDNPASGDVVLSNGATGVGIFAGIDATATTWDTRPCEGFDAADAWNLQPGHSGLTHQWPIGAGPYTAYHFWEGDEDGSEYIYVTVEREAGFFLHYALGRVVPFGSIVGGVFSDCTFPSTSINQMNNPDNGTHRHICDANCDGTTQFWVDHDGDLNQWHRILSAGNHSENAHTGSTRSAGIYAPLMQVAYQRYNLRTPLWPMVYFANRAANLRSAVGRMPNIRQVNLRNLFPGEELTIGGEVWKCFPVIQRHNEAVAGSVATSGLYGYAFLMP